MKRNIQMSVVSVASALALFATVAYAADPAMTGDAMHGDSAKPSSMMMMHPPAPMILSVTNDGMGRLRGVVSAVGTNSISVAAWGGTWTITTDANTSMLPAGSTLSGIQVGDYVGVIGKVSENAPTIMATVLRDWKTKTAAMHKDTMMPHDTMAPHDTMPPHDAMTPHDSMSTSSGAMMH